MSADANPCTQGPELAGNPDNVPYQVLKDYIFFLIVNKSNVKSKTNTVGLSFIPSHPQAHSFQLNLKKKRVKNSEKGSVIF